MPRRVDSNLVKKFQTPSKNSARSRRKLSKRLLKKLLMIFLVLSILVAFLTVSTRRK